MMDKYPLRVEARARHGFLEVPDVSAQTRAAFALAARVGEYDVVGDALFEQAVAFIFGACAEGGGI
jgi:hypothetical protein